VGHPTLNKSSLLIITRVNAMLNVNVKKLILKTTISMVLITTITACGGGGDQTDTTAPVSATVLKLNDTGITWGGNYPSGNNTTCTGETIDQQDCSFGRDVTHNDNSDGYAGFNFTKLSATGAELQASETTWSCVKDNVTGLVWEVKTDDNGIHDKDSTYRWGGQNSHVNR
jgi:hypothetical protein